MFKNLSKEQVSVVESQQIKNWEDNKILEKSSKDDSSKPSFVFYEGPPTANGKPGIHHVMARTLKDSVCRYKSMKGFVVKRKAGWDTHGLPVEIEVEKQLSISTKEDIEKYGIREFNDKCRDSVFTYEALWRDMTKRMGYMIDMDNPYITLDNNYIESCWWILKEFFKQDYIYEGHKIIPYCSRCGTGLSSHEVAQGYKDVKSLTVTAKFKKADEDAYFLAWTTTPWTLVSNVALCVGPDIDYIKVRYNQNDEIYYIAKDLADSVLGGNYEVLDSMKGKDLEYQEYQQLIPFVDVKEKAFFITCAEYVTTTDGTGIVHTAPAFGEDDYQTGKKYGLPVVNPVNEEGKYTETPWKDRFVLDDGLAIEIVKWLGNEDKVFSKAKMSHNYPHCWRCGTPLIYYSKPSWYIEMTRLKSQLVKNNNDVNWFPDFVGEKRFGNWLENVNDWAISRNRYWGTPIPIWKCDCGHIECIGSREELIDRAVDKNIDMDIDLHRPYVDDVRIHCDSCGKDDMKRIPEVIDCWFDSGSMPFAQQHYPFENKEKFHESLFPADFICEGIDQTRGWFYSLIAISTFLEGRAPYKNVLVNDLILDKEGKKMSKSKGNTVDPFALFDKYGADATRWYLLQISPAWAPTKFNEEGLKEVVSKFFGTLKNVYNFFVLYYNQDNLSLSDIEIEYEKKDILDKWILSKYHSLKKQFEEDMDSYDHMKAVRGVQNFVVEDLSNWYIRRSRRRFWQETLTDDKKAVYDTTYKILVGISQLIAPFAPFISDEIFVNLTGEESVHLSSLEAYNDSLINLELQKDMDIVRDVVALGRGVREKEKIKVRQPLNKVLIDSKYKYLQDLDYLIKEELNVKEVKFESYLDEFLIYNLKPDFKTAGPKLGADIKMFVKELNTLEASKVLKDLKLNGSFNITLGNNEYEITEDLISVDISAKEDFAVGIEKGLFTILDTKISQDLKKEGIVREIISKIQQMRKQMNFEMMDLIDIKIESEAYVWDAIMTHIEYIKKETLSQNISKCSNLDSVDINGYMTGIKIEKVNG